MIKNLGEAKQSGLWYDNDTRSMVIVEITDKLRAFEAKQENGAWQAATKRPLRTTEYGGEWVKIDDSLSVINPLPEPKQPPAMGPAFVPSCTGIVTMYRQKLITVSTDGVLLFNRNLCGDKIINSTDEELSAVIEAIKDAREKAKSVGAKFNEALVYEELVSEEED